MLFVCLIALVAWTSARLTRRYYREGLRPVPSQFDDVTYEQLALILAIAYLLWG